MKDNFDELSKQDGLKIRPTTRRCPKCGKGELYEKETTMGLEPSRIRVLWESCNTCKYFSEIVRESV